MSDNAIHLPVVSPRGWEISPPEQVLSEGWRLLVTCAGEYADASLLPAVGDWILAPVPGTAAKALAEAGRFDPADPLPLHDKDIWYVTSFRSEQPGPYRLVFAGLATLAEVYLNGDKILASETMFAAQEVCARVEENNTLAIVFRALEPELGRKGPRARWKTQLTPSQGLRHLRTTLLGHMPGWCPDVHAVGPWRPITLHKVDAPCLRDLAIRADLAPDGTGHLSVSFDWNKIGETAIVECAGRSVMLEAGPDGKVAGELSLPDIEPWMPATHGNPALYDIWLSFGGQKIHLGKTGFRRIEVDRGSDAKGFGLRVNGVPVFCRGAVWTTADLVGLSGGADTCRPLLELARDAGMNMLRIGGTMVYESRAFFDLCADLGIMVWQDFQFANFDYPVSDEQFSAAVKAEADHQLALLQGNPALAVLCGGSEIYQQGAMMGLPESRWRGELTRTVLADCSGLRRPDVPYVENAPCDGAMPFSSNEGIAHYYGVGAYRRPLEDARRADVRFAAECLGFSNVPSVQSLTEFGLATPHGPGWKAGIPKDRGANWDFEDIRDHYLKTLYGLEPEALRRECPDRYLDLSRSVVADILEATFAEWRRQESSCKGALVWNFQDVRPGAGWGMLDVAGRTKASYFALKRAFRPLQVSLTDEGTNGLMVHLANETPNERHVLLELTCLRDGRLPVVRGARDLTLASRDALTIAATDFFGAFFDTTYAFRFGPPSHDVTFARLTEQATGELLAEATHFPLGFLGEKHSLELDCNLTERGDGTCVLELETQRSWRFVQIDCPGYRTSDDGFHLHPGAARKIHLSPETASVTSTPPKGALRALNAGNAVVFSG